MKRQFKMTFLVEFDTDRDAERAVDDGEEPIDPALYMNERSDSLADGLNDALENYSFVTSFEKIEEVK